MWVVWQYRMDSFRDTLCIKGVILFIAYIVYNFNVGIMLVMCFLLPYFHQFITLYIVVTTHVKHLNFWYWIVPYLRGNCSYEASSSDSKGHGVLMIWTDGDPLPKFRWRSRPKLVPLFNWSGKLWWERAATSGYGEAGLGREEKEINGRVLKKLKKGKGVWSGMKRAVGGVKVGIEMTIH